MFEIIPNWHPIFVHLTVGIYSAAFGFYVLAYISRLLSFRPNIVTELEVTGRWCLWAASLSAVTTVVAGFYAFNTVRHDGASHMAMIDHRNWAVPTAIAIALVALWSGWRNYKRKALSLSFIIALFVIQGMLVGTAWRGAELVFRHGLGVMSLPIAEGEGHHHHGEMDMPIKGSSMPSMHHDDGQSHSE